MNGKIERKTKVMNMKKKTKTITETDDKTALEYKGQVIKFLGKNEIDSFDKLGRTPLFYSVIEGDKDLSELLIDAGASIDIKDIKGWTLLHFAAQNYDTEMLDYLLSKGAPVDAMDKFGNSVLWRAVFASKGRGEIIQSLLRSGANPDLKNNIGISPIELANSIANFEIIKHFVL
jgi:uncharacterized protein